MENPVSEDENCVLLFYHEGELSEISETDSSGTESYAYGIQIQSQRMVPDDDEFYNYQLMIFVD
jgi:hypothetical protein